MADFRITFLGTGTSQGVPVIGCDCSVCSSSDARDNRTRSSIYVETPELAFVVDTGTDFRTQCLRENVRRLDAVLFTHAHTDHVMGFDDLRAFCYPDRWLPVYATGATLDDLKRIFRFAFNGENLWPGYIKPIPTVITGPFNVGETEVRPFELEHGRTTTLGFLFSRHNRKLAAYLSDCKVVPEDALREIEGVDTLIVDALRYKSHPTHLSIPEALQIVERVQPRRTLFTHLCHELAHEETERDLPGHVRLAYDGLKIGFE